MTGGNIVDAETNEELCVTMELPWRNNERGRSCIPAGTYRCCLRWSEKHQRKVYEICDVPGRSDIEIHSANWPEQLLGCVATGTAFGKIEGRRGISESKKALDKLEAWASGEEFELTITDPKWDPVDAEGAEA